MKLRRKLTLLSSCALILQNFIATLPAGAFDTQDNMAAFLYWKLPLGGGSSSADTEPTYGFSVEQTQNGWLFAPDSAQQQQDFSDDVAMPRLFDLHFGGGQEMPTVAFSGVDMVPVLNGQLNAVDQPGSELGLGEWLAIGIGSALVIGGGVCAAICDDGHHHHAAAAEGPPT